MAIVYSDYNGRVLNSKWFFFSSVTASIVVFAIGVFAYLPTPFDTVIAYHKLESVVPTTIIAATPPDIEEAATSTEELAVVREEVVAALEMAEPEVEPTRARKRNQCHGTDSAVLLSIRRYYCRFLEEGWLWNR